MKRKINMENIVGNFIVDIDSFPEFESYPDRGLTNYRDSVVKEFEMNDGFFEYVVKARVEIWYERWYRSADVMGPEEDEILNYEVAVETISGTRMFIKNEGEMKLSHIELEQFEKLLMSKIQVQL